MTAGRAAHDFFSHLARHWAAVSRYNSLSAGSTRSRQTRCQPGAATMPSTRSVLAAVLGLGLVFLFRDAFSVSSPNTAGHGLMERDVDSRLAALEKETERLVGRPLGSQLPEPERAATTRPAAMRQELAVARQEPAAAPSAAASGAARPQAVAGERTHWYDGTFLVAKHEPASNAASLRRLLKSLLGLSRLLNRTLILPTSLCGDGQAAEPADEPLGCRRCSTLARDALPLDAWRRAAASFEGGGVRLRPANFLSDARLPERLRSSHVRVRLPDGASAIEAAAALRDYETTVVLEIDRAAEAFCGWEARHDTGHAGEAFEAAVSPLLGGSGAAQLAHCSHFHAGAVTVLSFVSLGTSAAHNVSAPWESLPRSVRELPRGSDLAVTFATGSVSTMALNWAKATVSAGLSDILLGALDESMLKACRAAGVPCVLIQGGEASVELAKVSGNLRSRPSLYPKMSVLKVGFYRELLSFGFNVWACDADAIFLADPRPLLRSPSFAGAHLAAATDCIDVALDTRSPLLHCDLNTGLVYLRSSAETIAFAEAWRETIAHAKEARIRDQYAFNMLLKSGGSSLKRDAAARQAGPRIFRATPAGGSLLLGVLPLSHFLNGHTYFVQHAHTLPAAPQPLAVHLTYQFAEGASFAHGKRQRLRQAGLWFVDEDEYYAGRFVRVGDSAATLPPSPLPPNVTSLTAINAHLAEARHRSRVLQALLGIGKALGRTVILPRMLCYCDFMWKEMTHCRVGGAFGMRLPFDCPMDHVCDTPRWMEQGVPGVTVREQGFLSNPRVPRSVSGSVQRVALRPGMTDADLRRELGAESAAVLEVADAVGTFCGFADAGTNRSFAQAVGRLLAYKRTPFCYDDGPGPRAPGYSQCCTPRKPGDPFFPCKYGFDPPEPFPACARRGR